jgi:hypothetical protein
MNILLTLENSVFIFIRDIRDKRDIRDMTNMNIILKTENSSVMS